MISMVCLLEKNWVRNHPIQVGSAFIELNISKYVCMFIIIPLFISTFIFILRVGLSVNQGTILCVSVCECVHLYNLSKVHIDCLCIKNNFTLNHFSNSSSNALFATQSFSRNFISQIFFLNSVYSFFMPLKFQLTLKTFVYYSTINCTGVGFLSNLSLHVNL